MPDYGHSIGNEPVLPESIYVCVWHTIFIAEIGQVLSVSMLAYSLSLREWPNDSSWC